VVGLDVQPGDADGLETVQIGHREHVEPPGLGLGGSERFGDYLLDLLAGARVERQMLGGGGVAVDGVQRVHVIGGDFPQPESRTGDLNVAHGQTLTPQKPQG
jgi:hypothetical protein